VRPWPKGLGGQVLLLVAAALFVGQAVSFVLLLRASEQRRSEFGQAIAAAMVVQAVSDYRLGDLDSRQSFSNRYAQATVASASAIDRRLVRIPVLEARIAQELETANLAAGEVRAARIREGHRGDDRLLLSVEVGRDRWVNIIGPIPSRGDEPVWWLLGQTLFLFGGLLVIVFWGGRRVARSLARLTSAAAGFGRELRLEPVPVEGPSDIRRLIEAINAMQGRILAMLDEKDRMLGAIGHDLRTPLASLRLRAESVVDAGERQRMVETIEEMSRMLEDILSLARLGRSSEPAVMLDLAALLDALVGDLQDLGQDVAMEPAGRLPASLPPVQLRRAFRNLLDNAVKYGNRAHVRVRRDGNDAVIEIDDDGPGIPPDELERVLDGFVRLETSRSRQTGGSGLGLTIAAGIIRAQGGTLQLSNRPQGGLRVTVRLPLR
jgi:signal transduction histidine kinase